MKIKILVLVGVVLGAIPASSEAGCGGGLLGRLANRRAGAGGCASSGFSTRQTVVTRARSFRTVKAAPAPVVVLVDSAKAKAATGGCPCVKP